MLPDFGAPDQHGLPAGQEHGQTNSRHGAAAQPPVPEVTRGHSHCASLSFYDALS